MCIYLTITIFIYTNTARSLHSSSAIHIPPFMFDKEKQNKIFYTHEWSQIIYLWKLEISMLHTSVPRGPVTDPRLGRAEGKRQPIATRNFMDSFASLSPLPPP